MVFFFSSRRRHTRCPRDWSSDVCSSDLINEHIAGNLIVRAVDDADFINRSLRDLQADIERTNADFVIIDPFYFLDYEANTSRTARGDAAATSMKVMRYAGTSSVVIIAITQAEETKEETTDNGVRE